MHLRKISSAFHVALESLSFNNVRLSTVEIAELNQQRTTTTVAATRTFYTAISRKVVGKSARDNPERHYG